MFGQWHLDFPVFFLGEFPFGKNGIGGNVLLKIAYDKLFWLSFNIYNYIYISVVDIFSFDAYMQASDNLYCAPRTCTECNDSILKISVGLLPL